MNTCLFVTAIIAQQVSGARDFLTLAPLIVEAAVRDAEPQARSHPRLVLINTPSFLVQGSMAAALDLQLRDVKKALHRPFEDATPGSAVQCRSRTNGLPSDCSVREDGLYIELNYFMLSPPGYEVVFTWKQNGPRLPGLGGTIDSRVVKVWFVDVGGAWTATRREVLSGT